jgi:hypothetical protein
MTDLRKYARGKPCKVRLEGCDGGGETTVLAHYSLSGISGRGLKSPDLIGAWCCHPCHVLIDGQAHVANLTRDDVRLAFAEGVFRTQYALIKEGLLGDV